jgi:hypothetical protein
MQLCGGAGRQAGSGMEELVNSVPVLRRERKRGFPFQGSPFPSFHTLSPDSADKQARLARAEPAWTAQNLKIKGLSLFSPFFIFSLFLSTKRG